MELSFNIESENGLEIQERFDELVNQDKELLSVITQELIESRKNYLGEGMTAEVHFFDSRPHLCAKIISKNTLKPGAPHYNSVYSEYDFLVKTKEISGEVKIPTPYFAAELVDDSEPIENTDKAKILVMENIKGSSLADVLNGNASLPENFDVTSFFDKLNRFLTKMHEDLSIYHRDLHEGNIMVTTEGEPVVIDFGAAIEAYGDENPYKNENIRETTIFVSDDKRAKDAEKKIRNFMAGKLV